MSDEAEYAAMAHKDWLAHRSADMDPEGGFEEVFGRLPDVEALKAAFYDLRVPYRDYTKGGPEWCREVEGNA
jgi:hypothetical protein